MDNKQTNGFNDIIVKADITQNIWSTGFYDIGRELKSENTRQEKVRLKYNGDTLHRGRKSRMASLIASR
ncbi:TPA: hypothetical protein PXF07_000719 [Mannheimia haemolytica]|uniref:Uncharacterized protein n=1 Tax=Mannheimia haemolytica TaxID=75985 RepID=A0A547EE59_MANHA|nr:hypothetical protein [Mannheimia haemolytica]AWW72668.1 hypothetical protein C4O86_13160 [Pasteurellaceae bacterium 12565]AGI31280.1 hypothetical protein D650_60 [Mannheimia haemolytica USDA-ARS-USMARC-183]AGI34074.1 hypothetical protein D648_690 [Mannheimia haemolytica USDA-ARS-USMARC-185]AGQ25862.1 hypothetical protein F382_07795 [Mannheimia haemolytica D153]AGQ41439.1 hypothetical protein J451_08175 [Mannheimia haemolytica D174]